MATISISDIEQAVTQLSPEQLQAFRAWFAEFDAQAWDRQYDEDVKAGRLTALEEEAERDARDGRVADL